MISCGGWGRRCCIKPIGCQLRQLNTIKTLACMLNSLLSDINMSSAGKLYGTSIMQS